MKKLLIVESPGKIKTLKKILGPEFRVEASIGHVMELAFTGPKRLGFEFNIERRKVITHYSPRKERGEEVLRRLREAAKNCDIIYLASDPDREGESISWHLSRELGLKGKNFHRICFTEITEREIKKAIGNPGTINIELVDSQRARQCLDKLVGFEVSPLLWASTGGKSAGRVQSSTLHLICEREKERLEFIPKDYWVLKAKYAPLDKPVFEASFKKLVFEKLEPGAEKPDPHHVFTEAEATRIRDMALANEHVVLNVENKEEDNFPPPPLITSSLQQVAGVMFKFSPKHTMKVAQELYEGIDGKGVITYMRTDSTALSQDFIAEARQYLTELHPETLPEKPPHYKTKDNTQGAHEAIRPTSAYFTPEKAKTKLSPDQHRLYELVWNRAMASQSKPARLSKSKILLKADETHWEAMGTVVLKPGYLIFWKNKSLEQDKHLPVLTVGDKIPCREIKIDKRTTEPPPRYSEPRLVQTMERKGIGRPSTYASTIATLKDRDYVILEKNVLAPTDLGMKSDEALVRAIPELTNTEFTAEMESSLDQIADGKKSMDEYLISWAQDFLEPALKKAREILGVKEGAPSSYASGGGGEKGKTVSPKALQKLTEKRDKALIKAQKEKIQPICPKGHGLMLLKASTKSKTLYWKCSAPQCEEFAWYVELSTHKCPTCGKPMEKIPSKKVEGGYFLKCKDASHGEQVMFKDRKTKEWVLAAKR